MIVVILSISDVHGIFFSKLNRRKIVCLVMIYLISNSQTSKNVYLIQITLIHGKFLVFTLPIDFIPFCNVVLI